MGAHQRVGGGGVGVRAAWCARGVSESLAADDRLSQVHRNVRERSRPAFHRGAGAGTQRGAREIGGCTRVASSCEGGASRRVADGLQFADGAGASSARPWQPGGLPGGRRHGEWQVAWLGRRVAVWRGVAAWRRGGVAVWRCASRQRRACAAEGELRVSCVRAATSSRAYGVARMRRRQTAARLVAALWCSRMSWRGPLFGSRSSGCGGRAVDRVSLRVSLLCARSLEVSREGRMTVDTCTVVVCGGAAMRASGVCTGQRP